MMCGKVVIAVALILYSNITAEESNESDDREDNEECIQKCKTGAEIIDSYKDCSDYTNVIGKCCRQCTVPIKTPKNHTSTSNSKYALTSTETTGVDLNDSSRTTSTMTTFAVDNNGAQSCRTSYDTVRHDSVSLGLAIGLLFVGMAIGVVVTCLLCVCVPTLNRKATSVLSSRKLLKPKKDMTVRSAPQTSSKLQYESNLSVHDHLDSHIYTGIQTEIPLTDGRQITSPVYNVISEDGNQASVTKGPNADYQGLNDSRADDTYRQLDGPGNIVNNSIGQELGDDGDELTNHNYFKLNPHKVCSEDTPDMADNTDSTAYFVLEQNPSGNEETKCESQHDYFILKKE